MSEPEKETTEPTPIDRMSGKPANSRFVDVLKRNDRHLSPEYIEALEDSLKAGALQLQRGEQGLGGTTAGVAALELHASHRVCHTGNRWEFEVPCDCYPHSLAGVSHALNEYQRAQGPQDHEHRIDVHISEDGFSMTARHAVDAIRLVNAALLKPHGLALMDESLAPDVANDKGKAHGR